MIVALCYNNKKYCVWVERSLVFVCENIIYRLERWKYISVICTEHQNATVTFITTFSNYSYFIKIGRKQNISVTCMIASGLIASGLIASANISSFLLNSISIHCTIRPAHFSFHLLWFHFLVETYSKTILRILLGYIILTFI